MAIGRPVSLTSNVASKSISVTATENQTLFTVTGGYRINELAVFRNGARLSDGADYTARDGATVTLIQGANLNDTVEFQIFDTFRVAEAIQTAEADQTINGNLTVTGTLTGAAIGIQSGGTVVGAAKTLNFIGTGNTFLMNGDTVDISISGGGGSGVASTITVADESSDTTCFPVFVTAATGNVNPKTGSNLTFNSNTGDLSASGQVSGATGSFTGDVSIGGTLTYEDVTNVDSVGIITAQTGVRVLAGGVGIADSIFHIGDDNTKIRFPAVDTFTVETDGGEKLRIDSVGRLLVDTTADRPIEQPFGNGLNSAQPGKIVVEDSGAGHLNLLVARENQSNAYGPVISLVKSRGTSDGSYTIVQSGDNLGTIQFGGSDGSADRVGVAIVAQVDTTPGSDDMPARLVFATTPDGSGHPTERLRIASAGQIGLGGANYGTSGQALVSNGSGSAPTWQDVSVGISSAQSSPSANTVVTLNLGTAQHHDLRLSAGITTITCTGGSAGDSHSIVITQPSSGTATVGFSTYFLFPSGATPAMSEGGSKVDLVSFVIKTQGSTGVATALLASAGLNYQ